MRYLAINEIVKQLFSIIYDMQTQMFVNMTMWNLKSAQVDKLSADHVATLMLIARKHAPCND